MELTVCFNFDGVCTRYKEWRGFDVFDDYWLWFIPKETARKTDFWNPPYQTIKEYFEYKPAVFQRIMEKSLEHQDN